MSVDYHIHTSRCGHAEGSMVEYVCRARDLALKQIGFADHLPLLTKQDMTLTMPVEQLDGYVQEIEQLREEFPDIGIKTGIEADYLPGMERDTAQLINSYGFDYVIGSVHFIDGWGFDDSRYLEGYENRDIYEIYEEYFGLVAGAARSGLFDVIGHLDLIKKYNFKPDRDITDLVEGTIAAIKEAGICIEINTGGLRKPTGEMYPGHEILRRCFNAGIPITLGSDAHSPNQVGMDFDMAIAVAKQAGYDRLAVFNKRERDFIALG